MITNNSTITTDIEQKYCAAVRAAAAAFRRSNADPRDDDANREYKNASQAVDYLCADLTDEQMDRLDAELGIEAGRDY